jgi:hypothetical protein
MIKPRNIKIGQNEPKITMMVTRWNFFRLFKIFKMGEKHQINESKQIFFRF